MNLIEACTEARKQHKAVCRKIEEYKYLLYPTRDICAGTLRKAAFIELDNRVTGDYRKNWGQNLDAEYFFARADEALAFLRFLKKARSKA